jgi:hypothetical protein
MTGQEQTGAPTGGQTGTDTTGMMMGDTAADTASMRMGDTARDTAGAMR